MADTVAGTDLIAAERKRQVEAEGWTPEHDDEHDDDLTVAAQCYMRAADAYRWKWRSDRRVREILGEQGVVPEEDEDYRRSVENPARHWFGWDKTPTDWPWDAPSWKPSPDPVRNLVKAGALIAAEIDRLQRAQLDRCQEGRTDG